MTNSFDSNDPASAANTRDFKITHTELVLSVDFATQQVAGSATLSLLKNSSSTCTILSLDILKLNIEQVHVRW